MRKKFGYLFLALLLPGLIFVFLRKFGKNEFSIPVYYEEGVQETTSGCGSYPVPYKVADSVMQMIRAEHKPVLVLADTSIEVKKNVARLTDELDGSFSVVKSKKHAAWARWEDCVFLLHKPWTAVLVDHHGQIRGYYAPRTREETDRLLVELRILLKQY